MKIALIGSAPSSVMGAPYQDQSFQQFVGGKPLLESRQFPYAGEEWAIWGCSPGVYGLAPRMNRWFELHRWEPGMPWFSPEYCNWMRAFNGPVYTTEVISDMPSSVRLPREEIAQEFGIFFLTSSLSFMLAMAIMEIQALRASDHNHNPADDAIGLWGVDMSATEEYGYQRAGCQFFIMEAQRRGIEVLIPPESDLGQPMPMYGICEWTRAHIKGTARVRELEARRNDAVNRTRMAAEETAFLNGALDNMNYMMQTWVLTENSPLCVPNLNGEQVTYFKPRNFGSLGPVPVPPGQHSGDDGPVVRPNGAGGAPLPS